MSLPVLKIKSKIKYYPNGEIVKFCEKCERKIDFMEKALQSATRDDVWCCIDCFSKQIQFQAKNKITLQEIKRQILKAGLKQ